MEMVSTAHFSYADMSSRVKQIRIIVQLYTTLNYYYHIVPCASEGKCVLLCYCVYLRGGVRRVCRKSSGGGGVALLRSG